MTNETMPRHPSDSASGLCAEQAGRLLSKVTKLADMRLDLCDCRSEILTQLVETIDAAGGMWTWGVSDPKAKEIAPVASIEIGLSELEIAAIIKMGLDPTMNEEFRIPVMKRMAGRSQDTTLRTDLYDRDTWTLTRMHANLAAGGFDEWIHCVRYSGEDTWASLHLMRRIGCPPFHAADQQLVDLAMGNITWLGATFDNSLPAEASVALTSRQRMVLMMQLDGLSRKQIAKRLQITTDTVGDHLKRIYEHFDVSSTGELAAMFLRNR